MIDAEKDDIMVLNKCIYNLVQTARQYHKKAVEVIYKIKFNSGEIDPCLF